MGINKVLNRAVVLLFLFLLSKSFGDNTGQPKDRFPKSLIFAGAADGKSFFTESSTWMTWFQARDYCKEFGLQLASISTDAQNAVLQNAFGSAINNSRYWTSGREYPKLSDFAWDSNGEVPPLMLLNFNGNTRPPRSCLLYYLSSSTSAGEFIASDCQFVFRVLCETPILP